jgi:hypothetical protein
MFRAERPALENGPKARRRTRLHDKTGPSVASVDDPCGQNVRMPQRGPLSSGTQQPGAAVLSGPSPPGLGLGHEDTGEVPNSDNICPFNAPEGAVLPRGDKLAPVGSRLFSAKPTQTPAIPSRLLWRQESIASPFLRRSR